MAERTGATDKGALRFDFRPPFTPAVSRRYNPPDAINGCTDESLLTTDTIYAREINLEFRIATLGTLQSVAYIVRAQDSRN